MADQTTLDGLDKFAEHRNVLRAMSLMTGEVAGIPLDIEGETLIVNPKYKFAEVFKRPEEPPEEGITFRNSFWSYRHKCVIYVYDDHSVIKWSFVPGVHHFDFDLHTMGCSYAWGIEQESKALQLLATLLAHHNFKQYLLTGMFLEKSRRSNVTYMFRRLKPTVAMVVNKQGNMRLLCTLCMHPMAYYAGSWAGAMCPTDDVIAHLMTMRGDEKMFWRKSNQHAPYRPESGL